MTANVLIVGCGQVGAFASAALERHGYKLIVADKAPATGFFARYGASVGKILTLDVADGRALACTAREHRIETAILAFGTTGVAFEAQDEAERRRGIDAPGMCARSALKAGVRRFVYVSSFAIYGRQPKDQLDETDAPAPDTSYGEAKLEAEAALIDAISGRADLVILRPCGVYGPIRFNGGSHSARLVDMMLFAASNNKPVTLQWSASDADEYIYVKDIAEAIARAAARPEGAGLGVYNVGTGTKIDAQALRRSVRRLFPRAVIELRKTPGRERPAMPLLDCSKIARECGFQPRFDIASGLRDQAAITGLLR